MLLSYAALRRLPVIVALTATPAAAQTPGDELFNARFPGAEVVAETSESYTEATFYTGPMKSAFETEARELLEGRFRQVHSSVPVGSSTLEVYRAYQREIEAAGFAPLFTCAKEPECGGRFPYLFATEREVRFAFGADFRFGLFELTQGEARELVHLLVQRPKADAPVSIVLEVMQTEAEAQVLEMLTASEIGAAIDSTGTAAIYGLEFESGSAALLPASEPVLREMAAFLNARPEAEILLVGHTDNVGALDFNIGLSEARSATVREALVGQFGVSGGRLTAHGVGFLAPKASNTSADGRARNRRVEMILR